MGVPVVMPEGELQQWMMTTACIDPVTGGIHLRRLDPVYVEVDFDKQVGFTQFGGELKLFPLDDGVPRPQLVVTDQVLVDGDGNWGIYPKHE